VVDLTWAGFIDSTFLRVVHDGRKRLRERGGRLSIVCDDQSMLRVFEITGLDRIFTICAPMQDASRRPELRSARGDQVPPTSSLIRN
jgi:anti-sigma B factor antagonist